MAAYGCITIENDSLVVADSVLLPADAGAIASGTVVSTQILDGTDLVIKESDESDSPAQKFDVQFTFSGITGNPVICLFTGRYQGNAAHDVWLYQWNYDTTAWVRVTAASDDFIHSTVDESLVFTLNHTADYVSAGEAKLRIYHNSNAVLTHRLYIDYIAIVSETLTLPVAGTKYKIVGLNDSPSHNLVVNGTAGSVTLQSNGDYEHSITSSFRGKGGSTVTCVLFVNGIETVHLFHRKLNDAGDVGSAGQSAIRAFSAGDILDWRFSSDLNDSFMSVDTMQCTVIKIDEEFGIRR